MRALAGFLGGVFLMSCTAPLEASASRIAWPKPLEVFQGELVEATVSGASLATVEGTLGKENIFFYASGPTAFRAVLGADVDAKPAVTKLRLRAKTLSGAEIRFDVPVKIKAKSFSRESFNVPPGFDQMTPENLEEIRREQAAFARVFSSGANERWWEAPFIRPVPHEESASSFGRRRVINGVARSPHGGLDLSAPAGTEVLAANHGKVVLAGNFFFAGGSVVLDHGGSLFTMYFHLAEIRVGEGERVSKGDVLALSGATGRVTGAHLHWGVRLGNARIDPLELIRKVSREWQAPPQSALPVRDTEK